MGENGKKKINYKVLLINLIISLGVGGLSAAVTKDMMTEYEDLNQPFLAPPQWVFPVVWTILFVLMGVSAYLICQSKCADKRLSLVVYGLNLFFNFMWSIFFFNWHWFLFSAVWLLLLILIVASMIYIFSSCDKLAAKLQIPYLIWLIIAAYLNISIYILN